MFSQELLVGVKCMWNLWWRVKPSLHLGMFVRGVIVGDQVDVLSLRCDLVDHLEEA